MATKTAILSKFTAGAAARSKWAKPLVAELIDVTTFNNSVNNKFAKAANLKLDESDDRQTTLIASPDDAKIWKKKQECLYLFLRNNEVMKIGGTRTGMKERFSSYLCGHCVPERLAKRTGKPFPGKMSVTNAHLYHTIEKGLLEGERWEIWTWILPPLTVNINIFDEEVEVIAQTYHAYESVTMKKFKNLAGHIPQLCNNSDPGY